MNIENSKIWDEVQGARRAADEIVRVCTVSLRAPRDAEIRPKIGFY